MTKVYVAGAISSNNLEESLQNIRKGIVMGKNLLMNGFVPYIPHLDFLFNIVTGDKIEVSTYYKYDLEWLKCCDVMLVLSDWENSKGVKAEIEFAKQNNIPIYYNVCDLLESRKV